MTTHLVTFADCSMSRSAELCVQSATRHGCGFASAQRAEAWLPAWIRRQRGLGYWQWKPDVILRAMSGHIRTGDVLIYSDAGVEFINNVNYIIDRMDQDIFLFGNMYEHVHWCKRDIVDEVWEIPAYDDPYIDYSPLHKGALVRDDDGGLSWENFGKQVQASVIFFRVNDNTRAFVKEWLDWCLFEDGRLIDDSPSVVPNHPEFKENRHDQAILTTMAYRDGHKLHWWPAQYNDGAFIYERGDYPDEGYPVLFHHHRKRNADWEAAA